VNLKKTFNVRAWRWKEYVIAAGVIFAIYVTLGIVFAGSGGSIPVPPANVPIQMYGATIANNRINTKAWSFDYDHAQLSPDASTGTVEGIRNGIVFKKGKPDLKISAEKITLDTQSLDFTAIGKVHVEKIDDKQKRSFDTDLVTWTNNAKLMRLDHGGYVHSGTETLTLGPTTVDFDAETFHIGKLNGGVDIHK
jgi:hypothetical protein